MKNLTVNPNLVIKKLMIPGTKLSAFVVDDFLLDTNSVMNFAHNIAYFNPMFSDNSFYPGIRDNMPQPYLRVLHAFFQNEILPKIDNKNYQESILHKSLLSLVSCKPANLIVDQKVPHIDSCDERDYAFVHYLSPEELGGTSIYKYIPKNIIEFKQQHKPYRPQFYFRTTDVTGDIQLPEGVEMVMPGDNVQMTVELLRLGNRSFFGNILIKLF